MCIVRSLILAVVTVAISGVAHAHEFWISPEDYTVTPDDRIVGHLRNGEEFSGSGYSYLPSRFTRFEIITGDTVRPVEGRVGDKPALDMPAGESGLSVVVHETTASRLTYTEWEKFVRFVEHKAMDGTLEAHRERGLPDAGFVELYSRYCKALIAVGDGAGADRPVGMLTEIVAEVNPYTDDLTAGLPLRVLYDGAPRANAQIELFEKAPDGAVTITLHTTDAEGRATVPVRAGHEYLADAVVMRSTGNDTVADGPVWETLWAALTFRVPE